MKGAANTHFVMPCLVVTKQSGLKKKLKGLAFLMHIKSQQPLLSYLITINFFNQNVFSNYFGISRSLPSLYSRALDC